MKHINIVLLLFFLLFSCKNKVVRITPVETLNYTFSSDSVYLYFLGGFKSEIIEINYKDAYYKRNDVTTDESLGLALIEVLPFHKNDTIKLAKRNPTKVLYIATPDTSYNHIEIWFDHDINELRYIFSDKPFRFE